MRRDEAKAVRVGNRRNSEYSGRLKIDCPLCLMTNTLRAGERKDFPETLKRPARARERKRKREGETSADTSNLFPLSKYLQH